MKLLDNSISHTRRALCTTTLVLLTGAVTAIAQSTSSAGSGSGPTTNNSRSGTGSYNQSSTGTTDTSSDASRRNSQSGSQTGTTGSYGAGTTRSGSTDSSYGTPGSTSSTGSMAGSSGQSDKLSWGDKRFVTKAADHGQSEVQIAQLATQQASNPEVRRFAQRLVADHTRVNSELMSLASNKNVKLDKDDGQDRTYRRLSNRQGQDFDQEFVEQMIDMHEADVKLFEKAAEDAKDQELRSFASRHVGHLREHLQQAQNLRSTIMPTGRTDDDASAGGSSATGNASGAYQSSGGSTSGAAATGSGASSSESATSNSDTGASTSGRATDSSSTSSSTSNDSTRSGSNR